MRVFITILLLCILSIAQDVSIELSVDSAFYIETKSTFTDHTGKTETYEQPPTLQGQFSVKLINVSDSLVSLYLWDDSHNVQFSRGDSSVVLVHQCPIMGMVRSKNRGTPQGVKKITLQPKSDTTLVYNSWSCSSPFWAKGWSGFYKGGEVIAQFRILPYSKGFHRKPTFEPIKPEQKKVFYIREQMDRWDAYLNSKECWEGAYLSNKVKIKIPRK